MNTKALNRKFGFVIGAACIAIALYQQIAHRHLIIWLLLIGGLLLLTAWMAPKRLNGLRLLWDKLGNILGTINTALILFFVFFLFITPIAIVMRLLGKDKLDLKFDAGTRSYWKPVKATDKSSMKQQF